MRGLLYRGELNPFSSLGSGNKKQQPSIFAADNVECAHLIIDGCDDLDEMLTAEMNAAKS